jgi:hypothetical protein
MCQAIYISSKKEIPEIPWNDESPGFYLKKVEHAGILEMLKPIFNSEYVYEALSHLGCACGLCYTLSFKEDDAEDYPQRVKDVQDFADYLDTHKKDNSLQLFSTSWEYFPSNYPSRKFRTSEIDQSEFYLEEMTILQVV